MRLARLDNVLLGVPLLLLLLLLAPTPRAQPSGEYAIGAGIGDVTGPVAEVGFMGYAMQNQTGGGLHLRQWARAVVVAQGAARVALVNVDVCMTFGNVKDAVIERLQAQLPGRYTQDNVVISSIHTHGGPAGFSSMMLYNTVTYGFVNETFESIVGGIVAAVVAADGNAKAGGRISTATGTLRNSSINRSAYSYLQNPADERAQYDADIDTQHTVFRYEDSAGNPVALQSIFAVHCTSMPNTNQLVTSDNKGVAALLSEARLNPNSLPGAARVVAQFFTSNEGDASPNVMGAVCYGPGGPACDFKHSTCDGRNEQCHAYGPGLLDWFASTREIATRQADHAQQLWDQATAAVSGPIRFIHTTVDMENVTVAPEFTTTNKTERTCVAAMGMSFAAGTTDGPGEFNFIQGDNTSASTPFWNAIRDLLEKPTPAEIQCQYPKPIFLNVGDFKKGIPSVVSPTWAPKVVPLQIVAVGDVAFLACPGEFTTMAGRRLRRRVQAAFAAAGLNMTVLILGLSNQYTGYITTYEEYQVQRYEAASTIFGPHTLAAYEQEFTRLATALAQGKTLPPGPPVPPSRSPLLLPHPADDRVPANTAFGQIVTDVKPTYSAGDVANATFWGANPRNIPHPSTQGFLLVEQQNASDWQVAFTDASWETRFYWHRIAQGESQVTVSWAIPAAQAPGVYRLRYLGHHKQGSTLTPFVGVSSAFHVQ